MAKEKAASRQEAKISPTPTKQEVASLAAGETPRVSGSSQMAVKADIHISQDGGGQSGRRTDNSRPPLTELDRAAVDHPKASTTPKKG